VSGLMSLLQDYLKDERTTLLKNQIELCTIGATDKLPLVVRALLAAVKEATRGLDGMRLTLALSYGSRDEIVRAVRAIATDVKRGALAVDDIGPEHLEAHLDSAGTPDPDLLIRTSGEMRISNFMLWQIAYTELYVTPIAWPDFTRARLDEALADYQRRQRRFGLTGAQVAPAGNARGRP